MTPQTSNMNDEAQIRRLILQENYAIAAQDVDPNLVRVPGSFRTETRDLAVHVSGDLALARWLFRISGAELGHPAMHTWMRNTVAYERKHGKCQVAPGHWSVPFSRETGKAGACESLTPFRPPAP